MRRRIVGLRHDLIYCVIHPTGDHDHRSYFFKIRNLLLEGSSQLIF
ncbi:MAG: hypothetical protein P8179_07815 [Candidatus Thiodiazotropha sp.]